MQNGRILITRPEPENTLSCERLHSLGWSTVPLPMLEIAPITEATQRAAIRSQIFNIDVFDYVIFVSKNAARLACDWLDACWPMLPSPRSCRGTGRRRGVASTGSALPRSWSRQRLW